MQLGAEMRGDDSCPTFALSAGICSNSLALQVAMAVGLPLAVVADARLPDDVETLVVMRMRERGLTFVRLSSQQQAPPCFHSVLYFVKTLGGVYVGESDHILQRLRRHRAEKPYFEYAYAAMCDNKTHARHLETTLINELRHMNVHILSDHDGSST